MRPLEFACFVFVFVLIAIFHRCVKSQSVKPARTKWNINLLRAHGKTLQCFSIFFFSACTPLQSRNLCSNVDITMYNFFSNSQRSWTPCSVRFSVKKNLRWFIEVMQHFCTLLFVLMWFCSSSSIRWKTDLWRRRFVSAQLKELNLSGAPLLHHLREGHCVRPVATIAIPPEPEIDLQVEQWVSLLYCRVVHHCHNTC
jgi:hypothetical protein